MNTTLRCLMTVAFFSALPSSLLAKPIQPLEELKVTEDRFATVEVLTDQGEFEYHLDNTGERDVSNALQEVFDRTAALGDVSAEFVFLPGVYSIDAPITVKMVCLKLKGTAHGGLDIFGMNLKSGTIFRFGKNTGPNCITFRRASHSKSFPSGESPWDHFDSKVEVEGMTFVGYNNTDVDTANGYSRFRGDEPNFRGLNWYPSKGRYKDAEKEGQRALFFPKGPGKNEMLRVNSCVFTDLYSGIETEYCDVCFITDSWFAQMVYGIRMQGHNPICMIKNNCFADLETGITLGEVTSSGLNDNGFAYVSKCFVIKDAQQTTINNNTLLNWKLSTGAAAFGGFVHVGSSQNLVMTGNTIKQELDSRTKTRTVDEQPNGRAFINIENARNLVFSHNAVDTIQTQTVVKLHNVSNSVITDNIITFADGGNAVAQTGTSEGNFYRPLNPADSAPFDSFKE
ncbi:NosD domain-containing protein [Rubripirellula amarantea]|uniref:NosD domain-containing protein n=1 Tax=Rubripirellula amarantea TaxID=2527999 RepID=UPI001F5E9B00|nr:NosD domain-containing protein [Rubripirellula amarantea]